jgi:hypothetical protein
MEDVIIKMRSCWNTVDINLSGVLSRRQSREDREHHVTEAELRVIPLQTKEYQIAKKPTEARKRQRISL